MALRSKYADEYNHDDDAHGYDADVQNEADPIRTGYEEVLDWVIKMAEITSNDSVLDLGSGTANLSLKIQSCSYLCCVDVSEKMTELAKPKLVHLSNVEFVQADVMEYFDQHNEKFDVVVSTYTIHHLVEDEKQVFFKQVWDHLKPGGRAVFGDLMTENTQVESELISKYRADGNHNVAGAMEEEFFWFVDSAVAGMKELGFDPEAKRFSDLSWGIVAKKPA
jgi:ubiquinone/menaquinone biosynthesis C-methylase UbiE